jgi:hypothetical protein
VGDAALRSTSQNFAATKKGWTPILDDLAGRGFEKNPATV